MFTESKQKCCAPAPLSSLQMGRPFRILIPTSQRGNFITPNQNLFVTSIISFFLSNCSRICLLFRPRQLRTTPPAKHTTCPSRRSVAPCLIAFATIDNDGRRRRRAATLQNYRPVFLPCWFQRLRLDYIFVFIFHLSFLLLFLSGIVYHATRRDGAFTFHCRHSFGVAWGIAPRCSHPGAGDLCPWCAPTPLGSNGSRSARYSWWSEINATAEWCVFYNP